MTRQNVLAKYFTADLIKISTLFFMSLDHQLLMFMANDVTVGEAFEKVKLFFHLKFNSPEVFRNRDPLSKEITTTFENQNFLYLPVTPDGYSVIYASLKNYSVSTFNFDSVAKAFFMTAGKPQR